MAGQTSNLAATNAAHFDGKASTYETEASTYLNEQCAATILAAVGPDFLQPDASTMLDYACGPGLTTDFLLRYVKRAVGADISAGMVKVYNDRVSVHNPLKL